jgi:GntR family transcriptional regulator
VYSRIAEAIRNGLLTPGSMIPTETELGTDMKVSRTVVREALMLLEEDGLIRARRGVGRFVSDTLPRIGIERIQPFEDVLGSPGQQVEVKRTQVVRQAGLRIRRPGHRRQARHRLLALGVRPDPRGRGDRPSAGERHGTTGQLRQGARRAP